MTATATRCLGQPLAGQTIGRITVGADDVQRFRHPFTMGSPVGAFKANGCVID